MMTGLEKLITKKGYSSIAIVGMTKNVGKTVTFNYLVETFEKSALTLGLISAGYDGERFDRLTLKDKPRIYAPFGALVATAKACFDAAEAELELLESSEFSTPLGEVFLARVKRAGLVELAGPGSVSSLRKLVAKMLDFGAEYVLVDGAINRLASASPLLTDGTILATGAALGPTMDDVIKKTVFRRNLFAAPAVESEMAAAARSGLEEGSAVLLHRDDCNIRIESVKGTIPLLAGAQLIDRCRQETEALVFGGAVVDKNLEEVMERYPITPTLIVKDATRLFISPERYYRFINQGGKIKVLDRINLVAITLNPTDPCGRGYDPQMFLERMKEALSPWPVFDLIYERSVHR
jgi:hypothetical protein